MRAILLAQWAIFYTWLKSKTPSFVVMTIRNYLDTKTNRETHEPERN